MSSESADGTKKLTVKFAYSNGGLAPTTTSFLVKYETPFSKIIDAWRGKHGFKDGTFKFTYEGERVQVDATCVTLHTRISCWRAARTTNEPLSAPSPIAQAKDARARRRRAD